MSGSIGIGRPIRHRVVSVPVTKFASLGSELDLDLSVLAVPVVVLWNVGKRVIVCALCKAPQHQGPQVVLVEESFATSFFGNLPHSELGVPARQSLALIERKTSRRDPHLSAAGRVGLQA